MATTKTVWVNVPVKVEVTENDNAERYISNLYQPEKIDCERFLMFGQYATQTEAGAALIALWVEVGKTLK